MHSEPVARFRIVTPLYHDVESFLILRERVVDILGPLVDGTREDSIRFYVVDDSAGHDPDVAKLRVLPDVSVVWPPFNLGHQRAIVLGLRAIAERIDDDDIVITMDSDGEDQPEDLPRLLGPLLDTDDPWRVAIARRTKRKESLVFRVLYLGFRVLFRALTGRYVRSGNYAAYRGATAKTMPFHPSFDLCYSSSLITMTNQPVFVPCARGTRYAGTSRMGVEKLLMHGVRMMMPFADRIAVRSLALFTVTAAVTVAVLALVVLGRVTDTWALADWWNWILLGGIVISGLGLVNFLVLFSGYVQTSALSLARIDQGVRIDDEPA